MTKLTQETEDVVAGLLSLKPFLEVHHCSTEVIDAAVSVIQLQAIRLMELSSEIVDLRASLRTTHREG